MAATNRSRGKPGRAIARLAGFTMIEVLIAFVLLSVGLLGIVSLQGMAKTNQHQALQRSRAIALADTMLERIRINPSEAGNAYNIGSIKPLDGSATGYSSTAPKDCRTAVCSTADLAARDLWEWNQDIGGRGVTSGSTPQGGLVDPRACIFFTPAAGLSDTGSVEILITWHGLVDSTDAVQSGDSSCGGAAAGADPYRRKLSVNSWVIDEGEI